MVSLWFLVFSYLYINLGLFLSSDFKFVFYILDFWFLIFEVILVFFNVLLLIKKFNKDEFVFIYRG